MASLRVVSWNVWWRFGGQWREREEGIVATLADLSPDVAGLQEVWATSTASQAEILADRLDLHAAFAAPSLPPPPDPPESPDQEGVELGVAILSRWPIVDVTTEELPTSHRDVRPVALIGTIDHPAGPLHVITAAVEWLPEYADDHLAQSQALADLLADDRFDGPLPVLLAADLNAPPGSTPIQAIREVAIDTWTAGGGAVDTPTLSSRNPLAPDDAPDQIDQRIDYVFVRRGTVDASVDVRQAFLAGDTPHDGLHPSDHYATVADIETSVAVRRRRDGRSR